MITRAPVPTVTGIIGAELNTAEGQDRSRKTMAVTVGTDKRIYVGRYFEFLFILTTTGYAQT